MFRNLLLPALLLAGAAACDGDTSNDEAVGTLRIIITTRGDTLDMDGFTLDPDGYTLDVADIGTYPMAIEDTGNWNKLPIDDYNASLSGVAANCAVENGAEKSIYVGVGETKLFFKVICT
jgi:hypothetical protein